MKAKRITYLLLLTVIPVLYCQEIEPVWFRYIQTPDSITQKNFNYHSSMYFATGERMATTYGYLFTYLDTLAIVHAGDSLVPIPLGPHQFATGGLRTPTFYSGVPGESRICGFEDDFYVRTYQGPLLTAVVKDSFAGNFQQWDFQKYSAEDKLEWENSAEMLFSKVYSVKQVGLNYVMMGNTRVMGELGDCVYPQALKISGSDGSELWRWVGDTTEGWKYYPRISDFAPARGGGVIAVGYKNPEDIWWGNQAYVMRLDGLGNLDTSFYFTDSLQFLDKHGQRFYLDSQLYSIQLLNDDNYLLYGKRLLNNRQSYSWFVKVDPYFHKIWEKYYDKRDGRNVLFLTLDSRIVLVGQNILVIDASGDSLAGYKLADVEWEDGFELQSIGGIALDEKDDLYINCMGYIAPKRETGYQLLKLRLPLALVPARDPLQALSFTEEITIPKHLSISSIDPNPFNSSTRISYILPQSGSVTAALYGIDGRKVLDLMNEFQSAGTHTMTVNAGGLASGVYVLRVEAGANVAVQKLVLAK